MKKYLLLLFLCTWMACKDVPDPNNPSTNLYGPFGREHSYDPIDYEMANNRFGDTTYTTLPSFYVSPLGNNTTGTGSALLPFQTIQYAINQVSEANGGIIRILTGNYSEQLEIDKQYDWLTPLVLYAEDGKGTVSINANYQNDYNIRISGQYVVVDGLELLNAKQHNILIEPARQADSYTRIRHCHIHGAASDLVKIMPCNGVLIEYCDLHDVAYPGYGIYGSCIAGIAVSNSICHHNYIHDNGSGGGGYFMKGSVNNYWCFNIIKNMTNPANDYERTAFGIQLGGEGDSYLYNQEGFYDFAQATQQYIWNNVFVNCAMSAIHIVNAHYSEILNNTFVNCGYQQGYPSWQKGVIRTSINKGIYDNFQSSRGLTLQNNIVYNEASFTTEKFLLQVEKEEFRNIGNHLAPFSHNTIFNSNETIEWGYEKDTTEDIINPLFTDVTQCDYSLQSLSPVQANGREIPRLQQGFETMDCNHNYTLKNRTVPFSRGAFQY